MSIEQIAVAMEELARRLQIEQMGYEARRLDALATELRAVHGDG